MATETPNGNGNTEEVMSNETMVKKLRATIEEEQADLDKLTRMVTTDPTSYEAQEKLYQRGECAGKIELATKILKALGAEV